ATIKLLKESLVANAATVGAHMKAGLSALMDQHPLIGDVRGRGLMLGVELVRDRTTKERAVEERNAVVNRSFERGLLVLDAGKNRSAAECRHEITKSRKLFLKNALSCFRGRLVGAARARRAAEVLNKVFSACSAVSAFPRPVSWNAPLVIAAGRDFA